MNCPRCWLVNPVTAQRCDCGYDFLSGSMKESLQNSNSLQTQSETLATQNEHEPYPFVLACRKCNEKLKWGEFACTNCGNKVYRGIPNSIDRLIVFMINIGIALILFWLMPADLFGLIPGGFHIGIRALIAITLVNRLIPAFSIHPKIAHVKLHLQSQINKLESIQREQGFDLEASKENWDSYFGDSPPLNYVLESLYSRDEVELLAYLPINDLTRKRLSELSLNENPTVKEKAVALMSRIKGDKEIVSIKKSTSLQEEIKKYKCLDCGQASWTTESKGCKKCGSKNLQNGGASESAVPVLADDATSAFSDKAAIQQDAISDDKAQTSGVLRDGKLVGVCSKCGTRVMPTSKGLCPACRQPFVEAE